MELNVEKIKNELYRLGWTYEDLAKACGLKHRQSIDDYFRRKSIKAAVKIGWALGIDPKDLIKS